MTKILYTVQFAIDTNAELPELAIHEAGTYWSDFEENIRSIGGDVKILGIEFKPDQESGS